MFAPNALTPIPIFLCPVVILSDAYAPRPILSEPVVSDVKAL